MQNPQTNDHDSLTYKAFLLMYQSLALPLTKFIAKRMGASEDATEEVFAKTVSAAWQGFNKFEHKSSYFTWICRIALNKIADYYRGQIHERSKFVAPFLEDLANLEDNRLTPDENYALQELRVSIRHCLDVLPTETRNLLYLRFWEEKTIKEIAKQTGMSERSIEGKLYRAKLMLKKLISDKYPESSKEYVRK
jgi:RNA polymerase sigma factor CnrH